MIIIDLISKAGEQLVALGFLVSIPLISMIIVSLIINTWKERAFWIMFITVLVSLMFAVIVYGLMVLGG